MTLLTGVKATTSINTSKPKEVEINLQRKTPQVTPVNLSAEETEVIWD